MILLDSDHVSVLRLKPGNLRRDHIVARLALAAADQVVAIPVVVTEETMCGWLSALAKERKSQRQVFAYRELADMFQFFARWPIITFDAAAADIFDQYNHSRLGTRDRKIAAIAIANNALR